MAGQVGSRSRVGYQKSIREEGKYKNVGVGQPESRSQSPHLEQGDTTVSISRDPEKIGCCYQSCSDCSPIPWRSPGPRGWVGKDNYPLKCHHFTESIIKALRGTPAAQGPLAPTSLFPIPTRAQIKPSGFAQFCSISCLNGTGSDPLQVLRKCSWNQ